jgi:predicted SnoaL-like aldol condensation-catalyzing enzyme
MKKSKSRRTATKAAAPRAKTAKRSLTRKKAAAKPVLSEQARLARNKKIVLAFYEQAINKKDFAAASKYMGETYTQHNPTAVDGPAGLKAWLEEFKKAYPDLRAEIKRVIAEGDYVVLHVYGINGPSPHGTAVVDIFRVEDGKVVEHWDVIQPVPAEASNGNTMF